MPDKVLICQNCHNPFVYSEYEQKINAQKNAPNPIYCPICAAIKKAEALHPPKPKTPK